MSVAYFDLYHIKFLQNFIFSKMIEQLCGI